MIITSPRIGPYAIIHPNLALLLIIFCSQFLLVIHYLPLKRMRLYDNDYVPTNQQMDILELVYKFRFINRHQIQKIIGHNDPRRVNAWLKDLVEHNYLGRIYSHKLLENTKPAIYYLNNEGIGWVRINYYEDKPERVKRFYQDKNASERFRNHCIGLCEMYIQYKSLESKSTHKYLFSTSTELWYEEELKTIRPDAHVERWPKDDNSHEDIYSFFFELFDYYIPMYALRYKIDQYIQLCFENDFDIFKNSLNDNYEISMVFPNQRKLNSIKRYIKKTLEDSFDTQNIVFLLTTIEKAKTKGLDSNDIWTVVKTE